MISVLLYVRMYIEKGCSFGPQVLSAREGVFPVRPSRARMHGSPCSFSAHAASYRTAVVQLVRAEVTQNTCMIEEKLCDRTRIIDEVLEASYHAVEYTTCKSGVHEGMQHDPP